MKLDDLGRILRDADPAAVMAAPDALSRVVRKVTRTSWATWKVPHDRCFLIDRFTLFKYVEQDELDLPPDHQLPQTVLLLERPSADRLTGPRDDLLARYWRLLFHVSIHRELEEKLAGAAPADLRRRIERLGPAAFEEARNVLTQDGHLATTADDQAAYVEFAAAYLELRHFAWNLLPVYFPSLPPQARVDALLGEDVNAESVFQRTRLPGAKDPAPKTDDQSDESHIFYYRLARAALRAGTAGDTVAAAILHTRAARVAPAALTGPAHAAAVRDIHSLIDRLKAAVGLTEAEAEAWRKVVPALLDKADQGSRPVEAALLYDLQRACLDHEQTTYTLDIVEWLLSAGHRPIKRPLDGQRFVRVPAHLRSATRRLTAARLNDADRQSLAALLRTALLKTEGKLRDRFRPVLTDALHDAGLRPTSLPEQAALAKTVEELLDRISAAGFLTFADLRDAIARGHVKLPDLAGTDEYLRGDLLLRLDRRLATLLDGVYRRSEFYVRWLERATSLAFGTHSGRWLTRNVALPFGGALLAAEFVWLVVYEHTKAVGEAIAPLPPSGYLTDEAEPLAAVTGVAAAARVFTPPPPPTESNLDFFHGWNERLWFHLAWLTLAVVFLVLIRSEKAREAAAEAGRALYRGSRYLLWDLPARAWAHPLVHWVLTSWPVQLGVNYLVKPAAVAAVVLLAAPPLWEFGPAARLGTFAGSVLLVNSRVGHAVEATLLQLAAGLIRLVRSGLIPGVVRWVSEVFRQFTDAIEWALARGDDWLRLRGGGGPLSVVARAAAGLVWFPVAFLTRFYLVVLVEPMINPLKLPLTLLFAKFVYPVLAVLGVFVFKRKEGGGWFDYEFTAAGVDTLSAFMPYALASAVMVGTYWLLPDAVTYLFWEMRENWRLYRANRPVRLKPAGVGPHGESISGLLHPGFHSGTVPRVYARLRAAERMAVRTDEWRFARTHRQQLREIEEAVGRFVTRELTTPVNLSPGWAGLHVFVGKVHLGTNRIRVELLLDRETAPAVMEWEDRSGWLVAGWAEPGWVAGLEDGPRRVFANALTYLFQRAGVDFVREQVRAELPAAATHFDFVPAGLVVWYGPRESAPVLYDVAHRADDPRPRRSDNLGAAAGPPVQADRLMFGRLRLTWPQWVAAWPAGSVEPPPRFGPPGFEPRVLPV